VANWHPDAKRVTHQDGGSYASGFDPRLVWHTTEGNGLPNYGGSAPHFTIDPRNGNLWQHIPLDRAARALKGQDAAGIATNGAHAIQVEIIGFAGDTDTWPDSYYGRLRKLAEWIEENANIASVETVDFQSRAHPMTREKWRTYKGHCGHQHVPGQDHWDPGEFKVDKVLGGLHGSDVRRELHVGDEGSDVVGLQRAINRRAAGMCRPERMVKVDGEYGEKTKRSAAFVGYVLGLGDSQDELVKDGTSEYVQDLIRHPGRRNDTQRERAGVRREKHGNCRHD
jgi:hypothetical protein